MRPRPRESVGRLTVSRNGEPHKPRAHAHTPVTRQRIGFSPLRGRGEGGSGSRAPLKGFARRHPFVQPQACSRRGEGVPPDWRPLLGSLRPHASPHTSVPRAHARQLLGCPALRTPSPGWHAAGTRLINKGSRGRKRSRKPPEVNRSSAVKRSRPPRVPPLVANRRWVPFGPRRVGPSDAGRLGGGRFSAHAEEAGNASSRKPGGRLSRFRRVAS
jgi:hypothetical protein